MDTPRLVLNRYCQALRCYGCTGHDPTKPYDVISNNPACAEGQFDATQLQVYSSNSNRFLCYAITYTSGASQVTHRYMTDLTSSRVNAERTTRTTFEGYYCPEDLCNADNTSYCIRSWTRLRSVMCATEFNATTCYTERYSTC
ncbi:uncharacterized protein LOC119593568 [Penaeus monodon]|uniref:uncharacterized protein LOC119593568 n=1 Tax=Penaeus monodon TaxID=6687 RepID=UPI0018A7AA95|nr:uncharacterized protein LOC119593568 [Penaeus monodon]